MTWAAIVGFFMPWREMSVDADASLACGQLVYRPGRVHATRFGFARHQARLQAEKDAVRQQYLGRRA